MTGQSQADADGLGELRGARGRLGRLLAALPPRGPQRLFAWVLLVNWFGIALLLTSSVLYFTRVAHLSAAQVGAGLTVAGLIGMTAGIPVGDLADRRDPGTVLRATMLVQAVATFAYLFVHNFIAFIVISVVDLLAMSASLATAGALTRRVGGHDLAEATRYRAITRVIMNVAVSFGSVVSAIAIGLDTPDAYRALLLGNALSYVLALVIAKRIPRYAPLPKPAKTKRWTAVRDVPFLAATALNGAMTLQMSVLMLPLPLWVVDHTHAPRWTASVALVINAIIVALLQVHIGKKVPTLRQGGRALRRAGLYFLVSCSAIGLAAGLPKWAAFAVLCGAVIVHSVGELWHASATFTLEFGLPPAHAQGQYQGLAGIGRDAARASAPAILVGAVLSAGRGGWIWLGIFLALAGLLGPAVTRWGERTRPPDAEISSADVTPGHTPEMKS